MPTTHSTLEGLVAVSEKSGVKALGYLTWFSIPDESVGLRSLKRALGVHGLPLSLAPKDTKAINVFKRAMREQDGKHRDNGVVTETTVAPVNETPEDCVYQITQLKRDLNERVIEYPKAMRVIFNKLSEELHFNPLGDVPRTDLLPIMEAIQDYFDKNGAKVTGARVRTVVRGYLRNEPDETRGIEGLSGENLRGKAGGIYFIPAKNIVQLQALSEALNELYGGRAYLHAVPMADGASERELIRRHHVANTRQEMLEAMGEVKDLLRADRGRAPRTDVVANQFARYQALKRRAILYKDLLKDEQEEINDMAAVLSKQLDKLVG